ncbi:MAG TPA: hypothetical protein VFX44_09885 [Solirubrobacterales bacterium]|nr:hypothetical protein [Solirubrobacterales bacterium]
MSADSPRDLSRKQKDLRVITAERLEAIVEAAERAAEGVIDDAEAQARRYLAQAREEADRQADGRVAELAELLDSLLGQAATLRQEAERLQATLEAAKSRLEGEEWLEPERAQDLPDPPPPEVPRLRAVDGADAEEDARRADASGARLLATQLAVSGSSREEIELRLRNGFKIEDTDAILDAILGPED